jgi:hypothetical protein
MSLTLVSVGPVMTRYDRSGGVFAPVDPIGITRDGPYSGSVGQGDGETKQEFHVASAFAACGTSEIHRRFTAR